MSTPLLYVLAVVAACLAAFAGGRLRRHVTAPDVPALAVVLALGVATATVIFFASRASVMPRWRLTGAVVGGLAVSAPLLAFSALGRRRDLPPTDLVPLLLVALGATVVGGAVPAVVVAVLTQCAEGCLDVR